METGTGGLRERKKRATTNAIERAAVRLALERGHAEVTVAEICELADVSRSTFFNHMPSLESAIFGRAIPLAPLDRVEAVLEDDRVPLTTALLRIVFLSAGHSLVNPEVAAGRLRLGREQPGAEPLVAGPVAQLLAELAEALADWLEHHPQRRLLPEADASREAGYLTTLVAAALRASLAGTAGDDDTVLDETAFEAAVDEIALLARRRTDQTGTEPS